MAKEKKKVKIPKSVLQLRDGPKKFAKKNDIKLKGKGMSKSDKKHAQKRLKKEYGAYAVKTLDKAVKILAENPAGGKKIDKVREGVDCVISDPKIMEMVAKLYQKSPDDYPNMMYLPSMIMNTIAYYNSDSISDEEKEVGKNLDTDALIKFCEKILKKQIKRYKSNGLSQTVAFQMATVIPTTKLLRNRHWYRRMIQQMYDIAAVDEVDPNDILRAVYKLNKDKNMSKKEFLDGFYSEFILTKSTNKAHNFNDNQKELHERLIENALTYMEALKPSKLRDMLKTYIKRRKTAEEYKNDTKRVIKFVDHAHSNSAYTNIQKVVQELIADNASNELYLG